MTFYGEAIRLERGENQSGTPLGIGGSFPPLLSNLYYHYDGLNVTANAGDSFCIYIGGDVKYLTLADTATATVNWILEIAGGVGTLDIYDGWDSAYSETGHAWATNHLGTFNIGGPERLIIPTTAITALNNYNWDGVSTIWITVTSGSVDFNQVKLAIWPPGGPVGGWSNIYTPTAELGPYYIDTVRRDNVLYDAAVTDSPYYRDNGNVDVNTGNDGIVDEYISMQGTIQSYHRTHPWAAVSDAQSDNAPTTGSTSGGATSVMGAGGGMNVSPWGIIDPPGDLVGANGTSYMTFGRCFIERTTFNPSPGSAGEGGVDGVDYICNPYEVPQEENGGYVQLVGEPDVWWIQPTCTVIGQALSSGGSPLEYYPVNGAFHYNVTPDAVPPARGLFHSGSPGYYDTDWVALSTAAGYTFMLPPGPLADGSPGAGNLVVLGTFTLPESNLIEVTAHHDIYISNLSAIYYVGGYPSPTSAGFGGSSLVAGAYDSGVTQPVFSTVINRLAYKTIMAPYRRWELNPPTVMPPMRQRQRGDGLTTDTRREVGRGITLQGSERRGSNTPY